MYMSYFNAPFILLVEDDYMYISSFNTPRDILLTCKNIRFCAELSVVVPRETVKDLQQEQQDRFHLPDH